MQHVLVLGGGLAGLAASAALGQSGFQVTLLEARPFLGGRATSYPVPDTPNDEEIDNCQHILLKCCVNLLDFYARLKVSDAIEFHRRFYWIEPGGRTSIMQAGVLPRPAHFTESFLGLKFLSWADKIAVGRAMLAILGEHGRRRDLDSITMLDWLREKKQTQGAIDRFWRQVLVSAINEELDRMAALHGFQVMWLGFLAGRDSYEMGIPRVPLASLYAPENWRNEANVHIEFRAPVTAIEVEGGRVKSVVAGGREWQADHYISALPFERLAALEGGAMQALALDLGGFEHSPITGIHLWFDRPVTDLPHGTLLDRTIQWFYAREGGWYLKLVVSASRDLLPMGKLEVVDLCLRELAEFVPAVQGARLVKSHVVKEVRATFSAKPGLEAVRPVSQTMLANFSLAGDWTRSGWPATMEGAVRSGYLAAEDASRRLGRPGKYLLPDIA